MVNSIFKWTWLIGSIIVSAYFAFYLFPGIYAGRTQSVVSIRFQAESPRGSGNIAYYPNLTKFRDDYIKDISDSHYLYFSSCEVLPLSQRPLCDKAKNWKKFDPQEIGCKDVITCKSDKYKLSEEDRFIYFAGIIPKQGASISIADQDKLSFAEPAGWGENAKWPIFFICLFLALKLGRALGEFMFLPFTR